MNALHKLTDRILTDRIVAGDADAFGILFNRYSKKIYRFAFFRIKEQETIDDIVNDVFLQFWQMCQSGTYIDNTKALIYKITRNKIIDYYRTRKEHQGLDKAVAIIDDFDIHSDILKDSEVQKLLQNLNMLKTEYKEVLQLRYVDDLSISEIAIVLGKSVGAVKVTIHRAIQKLKIIYSNKS